MNYWKTALRVNKIRLNIRRDSSLSSCYSSSLLVWSPLYLSFRAPLSLPFIYQSYQLALQMFDFDYAAWIWTVSWLDWRDEEKGKDSERRKKGDKTGEASNGGDRTGPFRPRPGWSPPPPSHPHARSEPRHRGTAARDLLASVLMSSSAAASAAAFLLLPLLAAAGDGVCPRPTAVASVLRLAAPSCPATGSPLGFHNHHAGVVEVILALLNFTVMRIEMCVDGFCRIYISFLHLLLQFDSEWIGSHSRG